MIKKNDRINQPIENSVITFSLGQFEVTTSSKEDPEIELSSE